jgi:hypothetical protein
MDNEMINSLTFALKNSRRFPALLVLILAVLASTGFASDSTSLRTDVVKAGSHKELARELIIRVANESNQTDGLLGPFTYGIKGSYEFRKGPVIEGTFIRLHEPGSPFIASFLDEGQLTIQFPGLLSRVQPLTIAGTAWINRMIDMYTNLGGIEFSRDGKIISLNAGLYAGTATREEASGRFLGAELALSRSFGPVEIAIVQMNGVIRTPGDPGSLGGGRYSKTGLEAAIAINSAGTLPVAVTLSIEKRYFNFGNGGPKNDPQDAYIFIGGMEINFGNIL